MNGFKEYLNEVLNSNEGEKVFRVFGYGNDLESGLVGYVKAFSIKDAIIKMCKNPKKVFG